MNIRPMSNSDAIKLTTPEERKSEIRYRLGHYSSEDILNVFKCANSYSGDFEFVYVFEADEIEDYFETEYDVLRACVYGNVENLNDLLRIDDYFNLESLTIDQLYDECWDWLDELVDYVMENWDRLSDALYTDDYELLDTWDNIDNGTYEE